MLQKLWAILGNRVRLSVFAQDYLLRPVKTLSWQRAFRGFLFFSR